MTLWMAGLSAMVVIFFRGPVMLGQMFSYRDVFTFFLPMKYFAKLSLSHRVIPMWNPYVQSGTPFLANVQAQVFYPLSAIAYLAPLPESFSAFIVVHYILSGIGMFLLLKEWSASDWAAFIGAVSFCMGGYLVSVHYLVTTLCTMSWAPLVILFTGRTLGEKGRRYMFLTPVLLGMQFLGGDPVSWAFTVVLAFAVNCTGRGGYRSNFIKFSSAVVVSLLLVSFQLWPFVELILHSGRATGLSIEESGAYSLRFHELLKYLWPLYFGDSARTMTSWGGGQTYIKSFYVGLLPLLVFPSMGRLVKEGRVRAIVGFGLLSIVLSFGYSLPIYPVLYRYAGFQFIRFPVRLMGVAGLCLSLLLGITADAALKQWTNERNVLYRYILWMSAWCGGLIIFMAFYFAGPGENWIYSTVLKYEWHRDNPFILSETMTYIRQGIVHSMGILLAYVLVLVFLYRRNISQPAGISLIILVQCFDLFHMNSSFYQTIDNDVFLRMTETERVVSDYTKKFQGCRVVPPPEDYPELKYVLGEGLYTAEAVRRERRLLFGNVNQFSSLENVRGGVQPDVARYSRLLTLMDGPSRPALMGLLGVCCGIRVEDGAVYVDEVSPRSSRAFLIHRVIVSRSRDDAWKDTVANLSVLSHEAVIEVPDRTMVMTASTAETDEGPGDVSILDMQPDGLTLNVRSPGERWLVVMNTFYPGWRATIDGHPEKIFRANYAFQALRIPEGIHRVEMKFTSSLFMIGSGVSLVCVVGMVIQCLRRIRRESETC